MLSSVSPFRMRWLRRCIADIIAGEDGLLPVVGSCTRMFVECWPGKTQKMETNNSDRLRLRLRPLMLLFLRTLILGRSAAMRGLRCRQRANSIPNSGSNLDSNSISNENAPTPSPTMIRRLRRGKRRWQRWHRASVSGPDPSTGIPGEHRRGPVPKRHRLFPRFPSRDRLSPCTLFSTGARAPDRQRRWIGARTARRRTRQRP